MEAKAIELFKRFSQVTVLYRTDDGEYFIELDDCQAYLTIRGSGTYSPVERTTPLPTLPTPWVEPPLIWGVVNNPLAYNATPETNPVLYPQILIYNVSVSGTYTNFRDSTNTSLEITSGDLQMGLVQLRWETGAWKKTIVVVPVNGAVAGGDARAVSGNEVFKSEASLWTATKLFFSSATSPYVESGVLNFGTCYVFSFGSSYLRLNAGSLDLNTYFTGTDVNDRFAICCTGLSNLFNRTGGVIVKNATDLSVVRYTEVGAVGEKNTLILFTYDKSTGKLKGNFQENAPNNTFAVNAPVWASGSAENDTVLNAYDKLFYTTIENPVIEENIIKWSTSLFIFNGTSGYISIPPGQFDLNPMITGTNNDRFFVCINASTFLKRVSSGSTTVNSSSFLVSSFVGGDAFNKGNIVIFKYDRVAGRLITPFVAADKDVFTGLNAQKFQYGTREELVFNKVNKTISWAQRLYIFNRARGTTVSQYLYIEPNVISFAEKVTEFPADIWFTCYAEVPTAFISGAQTGSAALSPANIKITSWSENQTVIRSKNTLVLFNYNALLNTIESPFLNQFAQTKALETATTTQAKTPWSNKYPGINEKLKKFFQKYLYTANETAENRTRIVAVGDSLLARHQHTSILNVNPAQNPPTLITKNVMAYLWENLKGIKAAYRRYDSGIFTETGTFELVETNAGWDDSGDIYSAVRSSAENNASISFVAGVENDYFNFIDRRHRVLPSTAISIAVSGGNGVLEFKLEGGAWAEANGATFSQEMPSPNTSLGIGNTQFQRRILFRKVGSGIGASLTVTLQNTISGTNFYYWGVELVPNGKKYVQLINVSRGGHSFEQLKYYVQTDVIDRNPDLVVLEIPLLNMVNENTDLQVNVNRFVDFVWGDRPGFENVRSLKNASDNWQNFQVLLVIPHHSRVHYTSGSAFLVNPDGYTAESIYNAIKGEIFRRSDLPLVDLSTAMISAINADNLYNGDYYSALRSSGVTGNGYMNDSLHQNDRGTEVWAKELCPIFWGNAY